MLRYHWLCQEECFRPSTENQWTCSMTLKLHISDGTLNFLNLRRKSWSLLGNSWNLPHFLWHCWHIHDPSLVTCSLTLSQNVPPVPQIPFMMQGYRWDVSYGAAWCYAEKSPSKNVTCSIFFTKKSFQETKIQNQEIQNLWKRQAFPLVVCMWECFIFLMYCKRYLFYLWRLSKIAPPIFVPTVRRASPVKTTSKVGTSLVLAVDQPKSWVQYGCFQK